MLIDIVILNFSIVILCLHFKECWDDDNDDDVRGEPGDHDFDEKTGESCASIGWQSGETQSRHHVRER